MIEILKNWWTGTAILVVGLLVVLGYNSMTADMESNYDRHQNATCEYTAESVEAGEITLQEYIDMGCD